MSRQKMRCSGAHSVLAAPYRTAARGKHPGCPSCCRTSAVQPNPIEVVSSSDQVEHASSRRRRVGNEGFGGAGWVSRI